MSDNLPPLPDWREHVEQRLRQWRQSFVNKSGDRLALDDFMDAASMEDLVDFVCDEWAEPQPEPLNLRDKAVQKRLVAQWGFVPQRTVRLTDDRKETFSLDGGKYEIDRNQAGLMIGARRHGEPWPAGFEQLRNMGVVHAMLDRIEADREALLAYGQQCRQQALEEAALRFEQVGGMIDPRSIAAAIRALKDET